MKMNGFHIFIKGDVIYKNRLRVIYIYIPGMICFMYCIYHGVADKVRRQVPKRRKGWGMVQADVCSLLENPTDKRRKCRALRDLSRDRRSPSSRLYIPGSRFFLFFCELQQ